MQRNRIINTILLIAAIGIIGFFLVQFTLHLSFPSSGILDRANRIQLISNAPLKQKFVASQNNLSRIKFAIDDYKLMLGDKMDIQISDGDCANTINENIVGMSTLLLENYNNFDFPPIQDSKDKQYCFILNYLPFNTDTTSTPEIYYSKNSPPFISLLDSSTGKEYTNRALAIKIAYRKDNWRQTIDELFQRISQYKPWFLKKYYLAYLVELILLMAIILIVCLTRL
jgi:hypothetical protein